MGFPTLWESKADGSFDAGYLEDRGRRDLREVRGFSRSFPEVGEEDISEPEKM